MNMFNWKTMGFGGVVLAALAWLFKDMLGLGDLFNSLFPKEAKAGEASAQTKPTQQQQTQSASGGATPQTQAEVQQTAREEAALRMESWKQNMQAMNVPPQVQATILAKEPQLLQQLEQAAALPAAQREQKINEVQILALEEASKPQLAAFKEKAEKLIANEMDAMIRSVKSNSDLPEKEKKAALDALQQQKEGRLKAFGEEFGNLTQEQRLHVALNLGNNQEKTLEMHAQSLKGLQEVMSADIKKIARDNNSLSWASSGLGWGSALLGVAGIGISFIPGAAVVGVPLAAACFGASAVTGVAAGACRMVNHSGKDGNATEFYVGMAEAAVSTLPIASTGLKVGMRAMRAGSEVAVETGVAGLEALNVAQKNASLVKGELRWAADAALEVKTLSKFVPTTDVPFVREALKDAVEVSGTSTLGQLTAGSRSAGDLAEQVAKQIADAGGHKSTQIMGRQAAYQYVEKSALGNATLRGENMLYIQSKDIVENATRSLVPSDTPAVKNAGTPSKTLLTP